MKIRREKLAAPLLKISTHAVAPAKFKRNRKGKIRGVNVHVVRVGNKAIILSRFNPDQQGWDETPWVERVTDLDNAVQSAMGCYHRYFDDPPGQPRIDSADNLPDRMDDVGRILDSFYSPPHNPTLPSNVLPRILAGPEVDSRPDWVWIDRTLYLTGGREERMPGSGSRCWIFNDHGLCAVFTALTIKCRHLELPPSRENQSLADLIQAAFGEQKIKQLEEERQKLRFQVWQLDEDEKLLQRRVRETTGELDAIQQR